VSAAETKTAEQAAPALAPATETATVSASTPSFGSFLGGGDSAPQTADQIALSLVADTTTIGAGKPFTVGIRMVIKPGWYTYWRYPGDDGLTTSIRWTLPPGFTASPAAWPIPEAHTTMIGDEPHLGYIYKGEIVLPVQITPPAQLPEGKVKLHAALTWQVCSESNCVPGSGSADLELPAGTPAPANTGLFQQADARLPGKDAPVQVTWDRSAADHFSLQISGTAKDDKLEFFALPTGEAKPGHPKAEQTGPGAWTVIVPITKGGAPNLPWEGVLVADKPDGSRIGWTISSTGAATSGETVAANQSSQSSPPSPGGSSDGAASSAGDGGGAPGFLWILFGAFLGGMILNVMPCVLPVIALKIFGFMKQAGDSPERIFRMGLAFVGGVFAFFLAMATAIIALKAAGSSFTWGYQFQNPYVLAGMICLVFVFGLNMLGVFELTLSSDATSTLSKLSSKEGYGGAFLHGLFTTLLGTSCTAPFLGVSIGYATTQSAPAVFLIFLVIAMGMSLPYLLLTARPKWMRFLPKPGAWMERAKQVMGFALLAVAAWLLGIFAHYHPDSGAGLIHYLLALALGCWIFGVMTRPAAGAATAVAIAIAGYFLLLQSPLREASQGGGKGDWLSDEVNASLKKGQPVFIDFTADWCINCKAYEHGVLDTEAVRDAMKNKNVLQLKADWTNGDPVITGWLKKFNRIGVPLYVLYRPGDKQPVVRDALTKQIVLDDLAPIKG
jgi:thiol:disulfide interchange protein DsbD